MKAKILAHIARHHSDGTATRTVMELHPAGETLLLHGTQHLQLHHAAGWTVRALGGAVWITQDGDVRDIVLEAGERLLLDRDGPALLSPLGEARICVANDAMGCAAKRAVREPVALPTPAFA